MVTITLDPRKPKELRIINDYLALKTPVKPTPQGVIGIILSTETGKKLVEPAVEHFNAGQEFTTQDLATHLNEHLGTVQSWIRVLGRPEKRAGVKMFGQRNGHYFIPASVHLGVKKFVARRDNDDDGSSDLDAFFDDLLED